MNALSGNFAVASGVWPGSTSALTSSFVIFSVGDDILRQAQFNAWAVANGLAFKRLIGSYKGQAEHSFICPAENLPMLSDWLTGQESVLHLGPLYRDGIAHGDREARLGFLREDGTAVSPPATQRLGLYGWAPRDEALRQEAWTYDPTLDEYFICRAQVGTAQAGQALMQAADEAQPRAPHAEEFDLGIWADDGGRHVD